MDFAKPFTQKSFFLIAGPCVIESRDQALFLARKLKEITTIRNIPFIFKASFDKANRTSLNSFRGLSISKGLDILAEISTSLNVKTLTDVHESSQCNLISQVVDVIQIPAFLCRQTDLIQSAAATGKTLNIKKGQFLAPWDIKYAIEKANNTKGHGSTWVTERGTSFGYGNLVVDFQSFYHLRQTKCPVIFDATHSVQQPGSCSNITGGNRDIIPILSRAAATAVDGFFFEVHEDPRQALSDKHSVISLKQLSDLLDQLLVIWQTGRSYILKEHAEQNI